MPCLLVLVCLYATQTLAHKHDMLCHVDKGGRHTPCCAVLDCVDKGSAIWYFGGHAAFPVFTLHSTAQHVLGMQCVCCQFYHAAETGCLRGKPARQRLACDLLRQQLRFAPCCHAQLQLAAAASCIHYSNEHSPHPLPSLPTSSCAASVSSRLLSLVSSLLRPSSSACLADRAAAWPSRSDARADASDCWRLRVLLLLCRRAAAMSRDTAQR